MRMAGTEFVGTITEHRNEQEDWIANFKVGDPICPHYCKSEELILEVQN